MKQYLGNIVSTIIGLLLALYLTTDINSDMIMNLIGGNADFELSDFYNRIDISGKVKTSHPDIVIVNIDNIYARKDIASLIDKLASYNPRVIGVDVIFKNSKDSVEDGLMVKVMSQHTDKIVTALALADTEFDREAYFEDNILLSSLPIDNFGAVNIISDRPGGIIRSFVTGFNTESGYIPSFAMAIAKRFSPEINSKVGKNDKKYNKLRYSDKLFDCIDPEQLDAFSTKLRNKIILLGSVSDAADFHSTPINAEFPGVLIHAEIISTILSSNYLTVTSDILTWIIAIMSALMFNYLYIRLKNNNAQNLILRLNLIGIVTVGIIFGCILYCQYNLFLNVIKIVLVIMLSQFVLDIWYCITAIGEWVQKRRKLLEGITVAFIVIFSSFTNVVAGERYMLYDVKGVVTRHNSGRQLFKGDTVENDELLGMSKNMELTLLDKPTGKLYISTSKVDATPKSIVEAANKQSKNILKRVYEVMTENIRKGGKPNGNSVGVSYRNDSELNANTEYVYSFLSDIIQRIDSFQDINEFFSVNIILTANVHKEVVWWTISNHLNIPLYFNILRIPQNEGEPSFILDCDAEIPALLIGPQDKIELPYELFFYTNACYYLIASDVDFDSEEINDFFLEKEDPIPIINFNHPIPCLIISPSIEK